MKHLKGKKLLILGGASLHKKFVETAHELGIITIVTDNIEDSPAKQISDISYDINVTEIDKLVEMCKKEKVDAVISGYLDFCQRYYQILCEKLNLPCYGTFEQFQTLTNKEIFKRKCIECGVDIIPSYTEEMVLRNQNNNIEFPVYVKPSYSRGSRGQKICYTIEETKQAILEAKKISEDNTAIIEKYMGDKDIIQVSYMVVNEKPYLIRTTDQYNGMIEDKMDHICIAASSPSVYTDSYIEKVNPKVEKLLKSLHIKNAPFFMQGFVDGDKVRFFDPGLRFPGTEFSRLLKEITSIDTPKALIEFAFTGKMDSILENLTDKSVYMNNNIIVNLFPSIKSGKIKQITSAEEILRIEGVKYITYRRKVGDVMIFTGDVNQRIGEVNLTANSALKIKNIINEVNDKLQITDEENNNMIFSKFNIKNWKEPKFK